MISQNPRVFIFQKHQKNYNLVKLAAFEARAVEDDRARRRRRQAMIPTPFSSRTYVEPQIWTVKKTLCFVFNCSFIVLTFESQTKIEFCMAPTAPLKFCTNLMKSRWGRRKDQRVLSSVGACSVIRERPAITTSHSGTFQLSSSKVSKVPEFKKRRTFHKIKFKRFKYNARAS